MKKYAIFLLFALLFAVFLPAGRVFGEDGNVCFLKNGGQGDGSSPDGAVGSLREAVRLLSGGGTLVVCGEYSFSEYIGLSEKDGSANTSPIEVTSVWNGSDYRMQNGAAFCFGGPGGSANLSLAGDFVFHDITLRTDGSSAERAVICNAHSVEFGEGIVCEKRGQAPYLSIVGSSFDDALDGECSIVIKSGTYKNVYCAGRGAAFDGNARLNISGGVFEGEVSSSGRGDGRSEITGDSFLNVSGGSFRSGIGALGDVGGECEANISGGFFKGEMRFSGTKNTLVIDNGSFDDVGAFVFRVVEDEKKTTDGEAAQVPNSVTVNGVSGDLDTLVGKLKNAGVEPAVNAEEGYEPAETAAETFPATEGPDEPETDDGPEETDPETAPPSRGDPPDRGNAVIVTALVALCVMSAAVFALRRFRLRS